MPLNDNIDQTERSILARTIYGEARGEGTEGMEAVACVVLNRVKSGITWWGSDIKSICLAPFQFSCWNRNDPNRAKLLAVTSDDPEFAEALDIADDAINDELDDCVAGATSYFSTSMPQPPHWAAGRSPVAEIGRHLFFVV